MRKCILLLFLAVIVSGCAVQSGNRVESLLSKNTAVWKDEMFTFHVSYSNVKMDERGLKFTETWLHKEAHGPGQYKIVGKVEIPLDLVQSSKRQIMEDYGIGKNTEVHLILQRKITSTGSIETVTESGEVRKEEKTENTSEVRIAFSDVNSARVWDRELTNYMQTQSSK
ncbi:hypothetical protein LLG95_08860 [bacterium]|nr:hypothetical protein [bacterium]